MKKAIQYLLIPATVFICWVVLSSFFDKEIADAGFKFPYKKAGLTEREAAAYLLDRFTYGATPGQIDKVLQQGMENWFAEQMEGSLTEDDSLNAKLSRFDLLQRSSAELVRIIPRGGKDLQLAVAAGVISKDSLGIAKSKAYKDVVDSFRAAKGFRQEYDLVKQVVSQKILRAAYTNNQLREVLTGFWFNHFNVSFYKNDCSLYLNDYERNIIRPNVFGKFGNMLLLTAKSPAMLSYLDNFTSVGINPDMDYNTGILRPAYVYGKNRKQDSIRDAQLVKNKSRNGLNENFAREVMELHTMGVDGGYTQQDVTQAAGLLTGWTIYPQGEFAPNYYLTKIFDKIGADSMAARGFIRDSDFVFTPIRHDPEDKTILGKKFSGKEGYSAGVAMLDMLAHHPSTAKFIARKLAVRFVSDNPPASLVTKMAKTFTAKDGDIKQVLITMVTAPEFWNKSTVAQKTKSPFELAISAVRGLNADIQQPFALFSWLDKMGEKIYYYQAPTGFPDRGAYWINTGSLLNRMNFGLAIAQQKIPGITVNLLALNKGHEPESTKDALVTYSALLLPGRPLDKTIERLTPLLNDPALDTKVNAAAASINKAKQPVKDTAMQGMAVNNTIKKQETLAVVNPPAKDKNLMAQVVGIIIGSPEFQRR